MNPNSKRHFENLDTLRFFAFLLVFLSHGFFRLEADNGVQKLNELSFFSHLGRLGVDFFFVLSSFLITWIILEERQATRNFKAGYFLIRRTLRIWPLYFLIVVLGYLVIFTQQYFSASSATHENPSAWWFILFAINFYIVYHGDSFLFFLVFLWSIAIEEQFYLFWTLVMQWLHKWLVPICLMLMGISLLYRFLHISDSSGLYFHTLSALGNFGVGALTALFCFQQSEKFQSLRDLPKTGIAGAYILLLVCILSYEQIFSSSFMMVSERLIFSLLFAFIIFEQSFCHHSLFKAGKSSALNYLGKISYGLYCYHGVAITFLVQALYYFRIGWDSFWMMTGVALLILLLTVLAAHLSYRYFERRFLEMRRGYY